MKLSDRTTQVLKSFCSINPSILVRPGSTLETMAPSMKVVAKATVDDTFDREFAIYDLSRFLGAVSMFKNPELTLEAKWARITANGRSLNYVYAAPETIIAPPKDKSVKLPSEDVEFKLEASVLADVVKAASVLGMPEIAVAGDGSSVTVGVANRADPTSHDFRIPVGETGHRFQLVFRFDTVSKFLTGDYDVTISLGGIARFRGAGIEYMVVAEDES